MRESERLREQADALAPVEAAHADAMALVRSAGTLLEAAQPTMEKLIESHNHVIGAGAVLHPGLFMRVHGNRNVELQVQLAKAVVAFVAEWHAIRDAALADGARFDRVEPTP
jgi:hypothetical protein